jgi:DNA topoisomerase I
MSKRLLIVESPAKVKTIGKVLGKDYTVLASFGHVRDLPKKKAIDIDAGFSPTYELIERNAKHVDAIARAAADCDEVLLATDLDREGEAISWHIAEILRSRAKLKRLPMQRVTFSEITPKAIKEAIAHPRPLSMSLVNAQQARRVLDYLYGFNLSPVLWRKVQGGLSAGRVQSPALRMIVDRENEIEAFVPREYWTIDAGLNQNGTPFKAKLSQLHGKKLDQFDLAEAGQAQNVRAELLGHAMRQGEGTLGALKVQDIQRKDRQRRASAPFTTSTLQQEASRKLGFGTQRTMRVAQSLYEGVAIDEGQVGLITYMRTDSVNPSTTALMHCRQHQTSTKAKARMRKKRTKRSGLRPRSARRPRCANS